MGKHRLQNSIWPRALQVFRQAWARHNVCMDPQPLAPEDADQWLEAVVEPLPQLNEMLEVLRRRCGIDFSGYKTTTLTRRARQRMARLSVLRPEDYLEMLQEQGGEREALSSELLVNVTEFFRDTEVFRQLEEQVLPDLLRGRDAMSKCLLPTLRPRPWRRPRVEAMRANASLQCPKACADAISRAIRPGACVPTPRCAGTWCLPATTC